MESVRFSETLASTNQPTRRLNAEEHHHYRHRRENLKSPIICVFITCLFSDVTYLVTMSWQLPSSKHHTFCFRRVIVLRFPQNFTREGNKSCIYILTLWDWREIVRKDSKRVEAKRKCWGRSERHFISAGKKEHHIVTRFPGSARSSFW
jgi:hypothetical protein